MIDPEYMFGEKQESVELWKISKYWMKRSNWRLQEIHWSDVYNFRKIKFYNSYF